MKTTAAYKAIAMFAIFVMFVGCLKNTNPPEYVKDVVAYKEGDDAFVVYFILADANGKMTSAVGSYDLVITQEVSEYSHGTVYKEKTELLSSRRESRLSDFQKAEVGMGAFAHDVLLYPVGRIRYSDLSRTPSEQGTGKVEIHFRQDGKSVISGSTTFSF